MLHLETFKGITDKASIHRRGAQPSSSSVAGRYLTRMSEHKPPSWNDSDDDPRGLQTHFGSLDRNTQHQLARKFSYKKQFLRLTLKILFRWLVSLLLAAIMMLCFYHYEKIKILTKDQVRWFNAVKTGLYLTLGLNLAVRDV